MRKLKLLISLSALCMAFCFTTINPVYASNLYDTNTSSTDSDDYYDEDDGGVEYEEGNTLTEQGEAINSLVENEMKDVDAETIDKKISEKGSDVIGWIQRASIAVCIAMFFVFGVKTLIGASRKEGIGPGLFGMACCAVVCVAILYGPEIMLLFKSWVTK